MFEYYGTNDWWDYLRARPTNDILAHSAKGTTWKDKKYIGKTPGGSYIYPKSVMKGWSSYVEPRGYTGQGPARPSSGYSASRPTSPMDRRASQASQFARTNKTVNSVPYKAKRFAENTGNAARGAMNRAWDATSDFVDNAGRFASNIYDRIRGNEAGSTWNRITRGDDHFDTEDFTDRAAALGRRAGDAARGAWDRATGGDGLDFGDVKRWARGAGDAIGNAGRQAWNATSDFVDNAGRAASGLYDRVRGNEAGSTWNRITRGDDHLDTEDFTDRAANAGRRIGNAVGDAYNRATGGDGLDFGDVRRWAGSARDWAGDRLGDAGRALNAAGRAAWDTTSDVVDATGRAASGLYDRVRGNEAGSTWNRITRGDDHLDTEDVTDRVGSALSRAGGQARQLFDAAGNRITTTAGQIGTNIGNAVAPGIDAVQRFGTDVGNTVQYMLDPAQQARVNDATQKAEYWERLAEETGNPELANLARRYRDQADRFRNYR